MDLVIDNKRSFKQHVDALFRKAKYKTNALKRIRSYLNIETSGLVIKNELSIKQHVVALYQEANFKTNALKLIRS